MKYCERGGLLVGAKGYVGGEHDAFWGAPYPEVGCGALRCGRCQALVRSRPAVYLDGKPDDVYARLGDPSAAFPPDPLDLQRIYACHCHAEAIDATGPAPNPDPHGLVDRSTPWRCAGHPFLELPARLDDVDLPASPDAAFYIQLLLRPEWPTPVHADAPGFGAARVVAALPPERRAQATAILADIARGADDRLTGRALRAIGYRPREPEAAVLAALARDLGTRLEQKDPDSAARPLGFYLAHGLAGRIRPDAAGTVDAAAVEALRGIALRTPLEFLVFPLLWVDATWCATHAAELIAVGNPWQNLLYGVRQSPDATATMTRALVTAGIELDAIRTYSDRQLQGSPGRAGVATALGD